MGEKQKYALKCVMMMTIAARARVNLSLLASHFVLALYVLSMRIFTYF